MKKIRITLVVLLLICGLGFIKVQAAAGGGSGGGVVLDGHMVYEGDNGYCELGGAQCPYLGPIVPIT